MSSKGKGNSWAEQEEAFFGAATSPRQSQPQPPATCLPCDPTVTPTDDENLTTRSRSNDHNNTNNNNRRRANLGAMLRSGADSIASRMPRNMSMPMPMQIILPHCVACGRLSPLRYRFQPFFPEERVCASHERDSSRNHDIVSAANDGVLLKQCCACGRYEPSYDPSRHLLDLGDGDGRALCAACMRTAIVDTDDAIPVWQDVLRFMRHDLDLDVWTEIESIPIIVAHRAALNDPRIDHGTPGLSHTRGICMYETETITSSSFFANNGIDTSLADADAHTDHRVTVTAILCLRGLPASLTGSILAHEAVHAWFRLHPRPPPGRQRGERLPPMVEEGCCQLIAHLYLHDRAALYHTMTSSTNDTSTYMEDARGGPSDDKLRQYFLSEIERDQSEVYGEGFRRAARGFAQLGLHALLDYVLLHHAFPNDS
uniref:Protein DA1-like domain-containing protein n=1 Tax=Attheya septentrionalis TaxID=420275 RepID=A0A7S2XRV9_9STRA|mmetsp:Transcript_3928/g.7068  ORF Transcript_3928/g.7068 Transcript_3928/m.7068 type:complete len:428 (+) Transcript_3928:295-1578(+)|eukprot:CAMPEP_0198285516 /NCGR_PEP_ID=MMETSP1449-20131203/4764_1 /TAXON_ID=420275 /ORGANISM="Attheya septentrionalis, Strain CCMP2084" /LENGTH=427 /DNA_ID=CAMNT_0043982939 /DNA_START=247 /DNA_END=1530 /DNA_ORIENTATION=+